MRQIETSEEPVPVGAVALGLIEVIERLPAALRFGEFLADGRHSLVHPVALLVLDEEIPPESPPDHLLGLLERSVGREQIDRPAVTLARLGREGPFHHLAVGGGRQVDYPYRLVRVYHTGEGRELEPVPAFLEEPAHAFQPPLLVAALVRSGPEPEFLPVVGENDDPALPAPPLLRDGPEIGDRLVRLPERDEIPEPLVDGKDAYVRAILLREEITPHPLRAETGALEMGVVHHDVLESRP